MLRVVLHTRTSEGRPGISCLELPSSVLAADAGEDRFKGSPGELLSRAADVRTSSNSSSHLGTSSTASRQHPLLFREAELPPWAMHLSPGANGWYRSGTYRFTASSPVDPPVEFEFEFKSGRLRTVSSAGVADEGGLPGTRVSSHGNHSRQAAAVDATPSTQSPPSVTSAVQEGQQRYECRRVNVASADGTRVPLTLVSARNPQQQQEGNQPGRGGQQQQQQLGQEGEAASLGPVLLQAYGAYGAVMDLSHDPNLRVLLDRGWTVRQLRFRQFPRQAAVMASGLKPR